MVAWKNVLRYHQNFQRHLQFVTSVFWFGHSEYFFQFPGDFSGIDIRIWSGIWSQVRFLIDDIYYGQKLTLLVGTFVLRHHHNFHSFSSTCFGLVILNLSSSFLGIYPALISRYGAVYGHTFAFLFM